MAISHSDVQINMGSLTCPDATVNRFMGTWRGQPALFTENRQLPSYTQGGIDVRDVLMNQVVFRRVHVHETSKHVSVIGVYQTEPARGSRVFLVEGPYHYVGLEDHVVANADANTILLLLKQAVEIVRDLHADGLVHGSIAAKAFVVDPSGNVCLASFENMRVEDPNAPFRPTGNRSISAMVFMAPELLQSLATDGVASLSWATDVYALGCLGYQLLTGIKPFSRYIHARTPAIAQSQLIAEVVDRQGRPERPQLVNEGLWSAIEACWAPNAASRPTAPILLQRLMSLV